MSHVAIRLTLTAAIGELDYIATTLSGAEHGVDRAVVTKAREHIKATSNNLLLLNARLCGDRPATSGAHELFRTPFRVE